MVVLLWGAWLRPTVAFPPSHSSGNPMKLFRCQNCEQLLYFENTQCERCSKRLGYLPWRATLSALDAKDDNWRTLARPQMLVRFCKNAGHGVCNWLIDPDDNASLCQACRFNRTIPDLTI